MLNVDSSATLPLRNEILSRFQRYLQLPTQQPFPQYELAIDHLVSWSREIFPSLNSAEWEELSSGVKKMESYNAAITVFRCESTKPNLILTWKGKKPELGSILINSHMDVVPVDESQWTYPPFEAKLETITESDGKTKRRVYARGAQDMKNVGAAYMEVLKLLVNSEYKPERTLHVIFVADEEIGGQDGWGCLIGESQAELWKSLNVRFGLDEGLSSGLNSDVIPIFYGEKATWFFEITATGNVGHGSQFIQDTATEKIYRLLRDKVFPFREQQQVQMRLQTENEKKKSSASHVISINLTGLKAGHTNKETGEFSSPNVIPRTATAVFDMRVATHLDLHEVDAMLHQWAESVNGTLKYLKRSMENGLTDLEDEMVKRFLKVVNSKMTTNLMIVPAGTDARFQRSKGVNALGYSFMPFTQSLFHNNDEYLDEDIYIQSIIHYVDILKEMLLE
ncbi:aminoacylase [Naegleria gruberi]|uniref:Aminoacylase n=1 Tax=Naegleria gruberi TaxID=5762 RepID=D2V5J2_NAEGR|nr:aminoacylase [Naegleria gruberi]EFC47661.1 aminoacylase [Naegleria gruberi]|eukprot:XP_002680405.1 aminoacylase [Naegleria gruberi]